MAKLERIENGNEYDKFSTNELYLRQAAVQNDTKKIYFDSNNKKELNQINAIKKMGLELSDSDKGQYITLAQLVELNEKVEKEKFSNKNEYDDKQINIVIDMIDEVVQQTKTEKNTIYGQDYLTDEQKDRAEKYMGEGAENVKNIYLKNAEILRDSGYWDDTTINERLEDIMSGKRLIGESYGVMMDELEEYGITDSNNNIVADWYTDEDAGINSYKAKTSLNLSKRNQNWANVPTYIEDDKQKEDNSKLVSEILKLLYGDGDKNTTIDNAIRTNATITLKNNNVSISELLSEENLKSLDEDTLSTLKTELENAKNAAGKINLSTLNSKLLNTIYEQSLTNQKNSESEEMKKLLNTKLTDLADEDDYYKDYLEALKSGSMTTQEIIEALNADDPKILEDLEKQLQENNLSKQINEILADILGNKNSGIKGAISKLKDLDNSNLEGNAYKTNLNDILSSIENELEKLTPQEETSKQEKIAMEEAKQQLLDKLSNDELKTLNNALNKELEPASGLFGTTPAVYAGDKYTNISELFTNPNLENVKQISRLNNFYKNNENTWGKDLFTENLANILADTQDTKLHNLNYKDKQTLLNMISFSDMENIGYFRNYSLKDIFTNILKPDTSNPQSIIDSLELRDYFIKSLNNSSDVLNKSYMIDSALNQPLKESLINISDTEIIKNIIINKGEGAIPWLETTLSDIIGSEYNSSNIAGIIFAAEKDLENN